MAEIYVLENITELCIFIAASYLSAALAGYRNPNPLLESIIIGGFCIGLWILRKKISRMWIFVASHFVVFAAAIAVWGFLTPNLFLLLCICGVTSISFVMRFAVTYKGNEAPNWVLVGLLIAFYFLTVTKENAVNVQYPVTRGVILGSIFIYIPMKILYDNRAGMQTFIHSRKRSTEMEEGSLKHGNRLITGLLAVGSAIAMILFSQGNFTFLYKMSVEILKVLWKTFVIVYGWIEAVLSWFMSYRIMENFRINIGEIEKAASESSVFSLLMDILSVVITLAMIAGLAYGIIQLLIYLFYGKKKDLKTTSEDGTTTSVHIKKEKKRANREKESKNQAEIRKQYRKNMKRFLKKEQRMPVTSTPTEQRHLVNQNGYFVTADVTAIYENARYGTKEPTKEDIKRLEKYFNEADIV